MNAGLLTEQITFLVPTKTKDEYGAASVTTYTPTTTTRARVKYLSGNKGTDNQEISYNYTLEIQIRHYHQINEDYLIEYNGKKYFIISIDRTIKDQITITAETYNE